MRGNKFRSRWSK